jgi:rSAM/selenodomain-associated transferase 2/rSAM/selenodomain-associated transferase 1
MNGKRLLIVFTRYPRPGQTKTRLTPALGPAGAAELQRKMTGHTVLMARQTASRSRATDLEIDYTGGSERRMRRWLGLGTSYVPQSDGDLGQRMSRAFLDGFQSERERIVIIGTDCPGLTPELVERAFEALGRHGLVLGPASDGGYYLIGLRRHVPELFRDIPWGTGNVLRSTLAAAESRNLSVEWLPPLTDVDRPEDLPTWEAAMPGPGEARAGSDISVVIPTLNEVDFIGPVVRAAQGEAREVIVVDGGSRDGTCVAAGRNGATVLRSQPPRAAQMNAGALAARGRLLLFLHADTRLPREYARSVRRVLGRPGTAAGAFGFETDGTGGGLAFIEAMTNLRSRILQLPYGDQGLFMSAETFHELGGYADLPVMEDFEIVRRLRSRGRVQIAPATAVVSARRWAALGILRTTAINQLMVAGFYAGVSMDALARFYKRERGTDTRA